MLVYCVEKANSGALVRATRKVFVSEAAAG